MSEAVLATSPTEHACIQTGFMGGCGRSKVRCCRSLVHMAVLHHHFNSSTSLKVIAPAKSRGITYLMPW